MNFNLQEFLYTLFFAIVAIVVYLSLGFQFTVIFFLIGIIAKLK